jgi:Fe-S-cluster containining protein
VIQAFIDLKALHRLFDAAQELLEKRLGAPTCIANCGKCCMVNVPYCSIIEGINMYSVLAGKGSKVLKKAIERSESWLLEPHKQVSIYEGMPMGFKSGKIIQEWKAVQKTQCPFLDGTSCTIHDVRPLTCRSYGIFRDSGGICPRPLGNGESLSKMMIIDSSQVEPLVKEFFSNCKSKQAEWVVRGFTPAMLLRAAKPQKMKEYIENNKIASAKLIGVDFNVDLMWQPQLEALRSGKSGEEIMLTEYYDESPDPISVLRR